MDPRTPKLSVMRTMRDGQRAVEIQVLNCNYNDFPALHALCKSLGYEGLVGISNAYRIICTTPEQIDAARNPLRAHFDATGSYIGS